MNLNQLPRYLAKYEKGRTGVNIAQIKDVVAAQGELFRTMSLWECLLLAKQIRDKAGVRSKS